VITRNLALKIGLAAALVLPAMAEDVTFTTSGTFDCGSAVGCSISNGGSTITFANNGNVANDTATGYTWVNLPAGSDPSVSDVNIMDFNDTSTSNGSSGALTDGATFTLKITQTSPPATPDSGTLSGVLSGQIFSSDTNAAINFGSNTTLVLGNITYTLDSPTWTMENPGNSIGSASFTAQVTPEPTFMLLTGLGFGCLAFVAWRRKRTA
jgi:hypothetical protein